MRGPRTNTVTITSLSLMGSASNHCVWSYAATVNGQDRWGTFIAARGLGSNAVYLLLMERYQFSER